MTEALVRRGPDDFGIFSDNGVGLGMRRLSIIDIENGKQPVWSQSRRYVLVFNGEIYNFKELRDELINFGFTFQSNGDAEVIVNLYEHEGINAFNRLRGMFAVAIWDNVFQELLLIRDQLGIKPVFYSSSDGNLVFGSEIKALLPVLPQKLTISAQALDALFAYTYIPSPYTIWKDISKLRPGHYLKWKNGKVEEFKYWDLIQSEENPNPSNSEIQNAIDDSIRAHLVSDVEVGAFLSGGLDSSTIVTRMQLQKENPIQALSVKFTSSSHLFDETIYAEELRHANGFDLEIHEVNASDYSSIPEILQSFDEPFADDSIVPSMAISKVAAERLKVVISGAGGDEIFGGYNRYQGIAVHDFISNIPGPIRRIILSPLIKCLARMIGTGSRRGDLLSRFEKFLNASSDDAYLGYVTATSEDVRQEIISDRVLRKVDMDTTPGMIREHQVRAAKLHPVKRAMYVDLNTYLPEDVLALSDRVGMWHSLEIRTPLADRQLAEFAFRLPSAELVSKTSKKIAFRRAASSWLPKSILGHSKQGFEGPTASWLRQDGEQVFRDVLESDLRNGHGLLNHQRLKELLEEHVGGSADHAKKLFTALTVMQWSRIYSDRIGEVS